MSSYSHTTASLIKQLQLVLLITVLLYFGGSLFIPMLYGLLIAIVLYPVCQSLEKRGWPRSLAITASLLIVIVLFAALIILLVIQVNVFRQDLPELLTKLKPSLTEWQQWIASHLGFSVVAQNDWWQHTINGYLNNAGNMIQNMLSATAGTFFMLFLVPVYAVLFLYNRATFVHFLVSVTGPTYREELKAVLGEVIHTYYNFIKGMVWVYLIVGVLNSIGLLALGIRHAILFGMLTAVMTIIPYVGIFISALLPISVAWITKDSMWYPIGVVVVFAVVQYLEANLIFPKVVATQLKVSTWATLVAIIAGGLLWGVSGMILFIPITGILKVVLQYIPEWRSYTILLGREDK